ncbi:MAG: hypothetical protein M3132_15470 [Actinomycetia bacterium]|nr:hypothetical protein [Actinomycetes bacterium]
MADLRVADQWRSGVLPLAVAAMLVLGACTSASATHTSESQTIRPGDGVLDCDDNQVVRALDISVSDTSEADVIRQAVTQWTDLGGVAEAVPSLELWTVVIDGRNVAVAYPEINGDNTWTVHDVQTCGEPDTGPAAIDGDSDCTTEFWWTVQGSIDPNTPGEASSPEEALRTTLNRYAGRHGGDIVLVDLTVGSLVVQQREVVVARATEVPAGGWVTITIVGCESFE